MTDQQIMALCLLQAVVAAAAVLCSLVILRNRWRTAGVRERSAVIGIGLFAASVLVSHVSMIWPGLVEGWPNPGSAQPTLAAMPVYLAQLVGLTLLSRPLLERWFGRQWVILSAVFALLIVTGSGAIA